MSKVVCGLKVHSAQNLFFKRKNTNLMPKTRPLILSDNPDRLIHLDAKRWAVIDCVLTAITGRSVVKRHSHFPERLLSLWFYAYCSIFIITHANQGGNSRQAILLCQHLVSGNRVSTAKLLTYHLAEMTETSPTTPQATSTTPLCWAVNIKSLTVSWLGCSTLGGTHLSN